MSKDNQVYLGTPIFGQLLQLFPKNVFNNSVSQTNSELYHCIVDTWSHFVFMAYGVLTTSSSLRDIGNNFELLGNKKNKLFENQLNSKSIQLLTNLSDINIVTDEHRLETILRNALNNAIKFTPQNGTITLDIYQLDHLVYIKISDNGVGMREEEIQNLLNKNTPFSTQGTDGEKGTGFGFQICKQFANEINAKIEMKSEVNKGTTFTLCIDTTLV